MTQTLELASQDLALRLHRFLKDIDPARWRQDQLATLKERLEGFETQLKDLFDRWPGQSDRLTDLRERLSTLAQVLREGSAELREGSDLRRSVKDYRKRLQHVYEDIARELKTLEIHVPSLRPTNFKRNVFHVLSALGVFSLIEFVLPPVWMFWAALAGVVLAWGMETLRRLSPAFSVFIMKVFAPVAHPHEYHRINSATWYTSALFLLSLTGSPLLCGVAVLVLGFGDPAAALIGRPYGRTPLLNGRSLEGSLAFVLAATLGVWASMALFHPTVAWPQALLIAFVASLVGSVAELLSSRVDDNLSIPVSAAASAWLVVWLLGLPL